MVHRRDGRSLIALATLTFSLCSCSHDLPTSSSGIDRSAVRGGLALPSAADAPGRAVALLVPVALAPLRYFPEMGIRDGGGGYGAAYSTYFRTTETNREFRRGFAEFAVPDFPEGVFGAQIVLRETRGGTAYPMAPDRHELSSYTDADLTVSTNDYDRPTSPVGTFETDANEETRTFKFDVSRLVARQRGANLGFRVKLETDPAQRGFIPLGSGFDGSSTPAGVVVEVTTTIPGAMDHLQEMIGRMIEGQVLPPGMKTFLLRELQQAEDLVRDADPDNDSGACGNLTAIIREVDGALSQRRGIAAPQAFYIMESALNLKQGLGCPDVTRRLRPPRGRQGPLAAQR